MRDILSRITLEFSQIHTSSLTAEDNQRLQTLYVVFEQISRKFIRKMHDIRDKKARIRALRDQIQRVETIIENYARLLLEVSNDLNEFNDPTNQLANVYSPYVNDKKIDSKTVLNFAKRISNHLNAHHLYKIEDQIPYHFQPPIVDNDTIKGSYLYFTCRTDGKETLKCTLPHCNIKNKSDIKFSEGMSYHLSKSAQLELSVQEPKTAFMKYTVDGTIPSLINGKDIREGENILEIQTTCTLKVVAFMQGFYESGMLEMVFIIESEEAQDPRFQRAIKIENVELADRPEHNMGGSIENVMESLDTPMVGYLMRTPSYTPHLNREISNKGDPHDES